MEEKWSKRDEEKLLLSVNSGHNWHITSTESLCGRFNPTSCRLKFSQLSNKAWNRNDDDLLWKSRHLIPLRTCQVSVRLRRPIHAIEERLNFLEIAMNKNSVKEPSDYLLGKETRQPSSRRKETVKGVDKGVQVNLAGGRQVTGTLKGSDQLVHDESVRGRKETAQDLAKFVDKGVHSGGRQVTGLDDLDEAVELVRGPDDAFEGY